MASNRDKMAEAEAKAARPVPTQATKEADVTAPKTDNVVTASTTIGVFTMQPDGTLRFTEPVNTYFTEFNAAKLFNVATVEHIHPTPKGRFAEVRMVLIEGTNRVRNNWVKVFIPNVGEPWSKAQTTKVNNEFVEKKTAKGQPIIVGGHKVDMDATGVRYSDIEQLALQVARLCKAAL